METNPNVHFCDKCEGECGGGIVDLGDNACSICGQHDAPHVYVPQAQLTTAQERIADLEIAETEWRLRWDEAQDRLQRIVEAGDRLADEAEFVIGALGEEAGQAPPLLTALDDLLATYREAVGGE